MEAASTAIGGLRVALQVVSSIKRPMLEIYELLRNVQGPPLELDGGEAVGTITTRFQSMFIDFTLVNIGGLPAEDVQLDFVGDGDSIVGKRVPAILLSGTIPRFPPGATRYLFQIYGHQDIIKGKDFEIHLKYDGPNSGFSRLLRIWYWLRNQRQYVHVYRFNAASYRDGILPHPEYFG